MSCLHPITLFDRKLGRSVSVPCGKCLDCRKRRQQDWTIRLIRESMDFKGSTYFLTLTYRDDDIPMFYHPDYARQPDWVINTDVPTLDKYDLKLFIQALRYRLDDVRYFACGEYGDKFRRPHYHMILFSRAFSSLPNLEEFIAECWKHGFVKVDQPSEQAFKYVSKYTLKSLGSSYFGVQAPFAMMSTKPAIGHGLIDDLTMDTLSDGLVMYDSQMHPYAIPRYILDKVLPKDNYNAFRVREKHKLINYFERRHALDFSERYIKNYYFKDRMAQIIDDLNLEKLVGMSLERELYGK